MDLISKAQEVLRIEISQLQRMAQRLDHSFPLTIEAMEKALLDGKKIIAIGVGKSENIGKKFVATLNSTGATAVSLSSQNALHGDLGVLSQDDLVLILSQSGSTSEIMTLVPHLKKRASKIIALTGKTDSPLALQSDLVLDTSVTEEACPLRLAPTSSSTNMLALCDALAMVLLEKRGFRAEDFAELHPAGHLGKYLLTKVSEIMRVQDRLATASPETQVQDVLSTMLSSRAGAAAIVDQDSKLLGIFTHGDFVRCYQADPQVGKQPVGALMTRSPITVYETDLAAEVVKILREHHIDDLIVLNHSQKVVGLIDIQDLSRSGLA